jgi:hypothetical protein
MATMPRDRKQETVVGTGLPTLRTKEKPGTDGTKERPSPTPTMLRTAETPNGFFREEELML